MYLLLSLGLLAGATSSVNDQVDALIKKTMSEKYIPGAQIAIVKNGKVVKKTSYGLASIEFNLPMKDTHVLQVFSSTKPVTGVLAARLLQKRLFGLEDQISKYFPNAPAKWADLKVKHLLSYTAGLPHLEFPASSNPTDQTVFEALANATMTSEPGTAWEYQQGGMTLFVLLVQKLTGKSYTQLVQEEVFAPLKMDSSMFGGSGFLVKNRNAISYKREANQWVNNIIDFDTVYSFTGTGLNTNVSDLSKLLIGLEDRSFLSEEFRNVMLSKQLYKNGKQIGYGLGWEVETVNSELFAGHEGGGCAWVHYYPNQKLGIIFLCNLNGARVDKVPIEIGKLMLSQK